MYQLNNSFFIAVVMKKMKYNLRQPDIWYIISSRVWCFKGADVASFKTISIYWVKFQELMVVPHHEIQQNFCACWPQILSWLKHLTFLFLGHLKVKVVMHGKFPLSLHLQHSNFGKLSSRSVSGVTVIEGTAVSSWAHIQTLDQATLACPLKGERALTASQSLSWMWLPK